MGKEYADNLAFKMRTVDLVAACSISEDELAYARDTLQVKQLYKDYDQMIEQADLEAVFIISSTDMHASQMIKALEAGLHVFCEKPLAITVESCVKVKEVASRNHQCRSKLAINGYRCRQAKGF